MNKDIAIAQADTLRTWAEQWSRDDESGSGEVAFLMARAARLMRGGKGTGDIADGLPAPVVATEVAAD
jgi:hypothetical protein